jgi:hypothetical protein
MKRIILSLLCLATVSSAFADDSKLVACLEQNNKLLSTRGSYQVSQAYGWGNGWVGDLKAQVTKDCDNVKGTLVTPINCTQVNQRDAVCSAVCKTKM